MFLPYQYNVSEPTEYFTLKVKTPNWYYRLLLIYISIIIFLLYSVFNYKYTKIYRINGYINDKNQIISYVPVFINIKNVSIGDKINNIKIDAYPRINFIGKIIDINDIPSNIKNDSFKSIYPESKGYYYKVIIKVVKNEQKLYRGFSAKVPLKLGKKYLIDWLF